MSKDTVTEKLYTLSTGDEVYRYEKSIVVFFKGRRKVLSTSVFNGGYHENYNAVFNHDAKQGAGMPCEMLAPTYTEQLQEGLRQTGAGWEILPTFLNRWKNRTKPELSISCLCWTRICRPEP